MDGGSGCPYHVLGLERTASREDVKAAFRDNAMRFHPDRFDPHRRGLRSEGGTIGVGTSPAVWLGVHGPVELNDPLSCHPRCRRDPSPQAAARFVEVRAAAESLLHGVSALRRVGARLPALLGRSTQFFRFAQDGSITMHCRCCSSPHIR